MKKFLLLFALFALAGVVFAIAVPRSTYTVHGSKNITLQSHIVGDFTRLEIGDAFEVDITYSADEKITVEAPPNVQNLVELNVKSGKLHVKFKNSAKVSTKSPVKIHISTAQLNEFLLSGSVSLSLKNPLKTGDLKLTAFGAASFKGDINVTKSSIVLSGAASAVFNGVSDNADIDLSGASSVEDYDFKITNLNVKLSGASSASITSTNSLSADLSGASSLTYMGNPGISRIDTSGAASVCKK